MTENDILRIAKNLRHYRTINAFSQQELAKQSGISISTIQKLEEGRHCNPRIGTLHKLSQALKISVSGLLRDL